MPDFENDVGEKKKRCVPGEMSSRMSQAVSLSLSLSCVSGIRMSQVASLPFSPSLSFSHTNMGLLGLIVMERQKASRGRSGTAPTAQELVCLLSCFRGQQEGAKGNSRTNSYAML